MQTNVFWGIVGAIVLIWIVLMVLVVGGAYGDYSDASNRLQTTVRSLERYSKKSAEELPTEQLEKAKSAYYSKWQQHVDQAREFFAARDARFEDLGGVSRAADWFSRYSDELAGLKASYREYAGLTDADAVPFVGLDRQPAEAELADAQKRWNILRTLVEQTMAHGGLVDGYTPKDRDTKNAKPLRDFQRYRVDYDFRIPGSKLVDLTNALLAHDTINFEIQHLAVAKSPDDLQYDVVREVRYDGDSTVEQATTEPRVRVALTVDILDWQPAETPEE